MVDPVALSFFLLLVSLKFFARVYMHARTDSFLTVASASARRARIENWKCAREKREKRSEEREMRDVYGR